MNALEACGRFAAMRHFPKDVPAAITGIAEIIEEHLHSEEQIDKLVRNMRRFDEWPGPATLEAECKAVANSEETQLRDWKPTYERNPRLCNDCGSWGHVQVNGRFGRCHCENGQALDEDFLRLLNSRTKLGRPDSKNKPLPVTQSDVDRVMSERRKT